MMDDSDDHSSQRRGEKKRIEKKRTDRHNVGEREDFR